MLQSQAQDQGLLSTVIQNFIHTQMNSMGRDLYGSQPAVLTAIMENGQDTFHVPMIVKRLPEYSPNTVRSCCYDICVKGYAIKAGTWRAPGSSVRYQLYKLTQQAHTWWGQQQ